MKWEDYQVIAERAATKLRTEMNDGKRRIGFGPVADGIDIPKGTFFDPANRYIPDIPMIFCSTFHEWNPNRDKPDLENISFDEVIERLIPNFGEKAREIVEEYAKTFPKCRPVEIWAMVVSNRKHAVNAADIKIRQSSPVFMGWFGWESPLFDGRHRAFHCIDISFWFLNTDLMITHTGGGSSPRNLSNKMADALVHFMRTGDPNCKSLPKWPRYSSDKGETMVFNNQCKMKNDPDREARQMLD
jgi:para-nitrobenzyl esterase